MKRIIAIDFETAAIQPLPEYPPKPTMLGIYERDKTPLYMSWGHPSGNNTTEETAKQVLSTLWNDPEIELVCHNAPFDVLVAHVHWGLSIKRAGLIHDTMVMAFLLEPHAMTYALKPIADKLLGLPPDESDAIRTWCQANGLIKTNAKEYGEHISKVPAEIVGPYCVGDIVRTMQLFERFTPKLAETRMLDAYHRELKIRDIMLENTRNGVSVNVDSLTCDIALYDSALAKIDELILTLLQCEPFNLDSDAQLADAIDKAHPGLVWSYTKTGKRSTAKANMEKTLEGLTGTLLAAMQYRASIKTCVNTFMRPWLIQATHPLGKGRMRCQWNTTRSDDGGARTGRLSSSPSLMNIPTLSSAKFTAVLALWEVHLKELDFPALPNVRSYIIPDPGHELVSLDYCLSPDTEFLTEHGFKLFDDIAPGTALAYWENGVIGFEQPVRRIDKQHIGDLVHVTGAKSLDMLGTPDHRMVLLKTTKDVSTAHKMMLSDVPFRRTGYLFLPQAGICDNVVPLDRAAITLVAAIQADGRIATQSTRRVIFKFSKQRKVDRLCAALTALKIEFKVKYYQYAYDSSAFTWIIFYAPAWVFEYIDIATKCLTRSILSMPASFLDEITYWDGARQKTAVSAAPGTSAQYFSVYRQNVELVQELAVLRNRHSVLSFKRAPSSFNGAGYYSVCIHKLAGSYTKTQSVAYEAYAGRVVCFEMPHGTLIARRKGRPFVTGNCAQELRVLAHYESDMLLKAYQEDPTQDLHQYAADLIARQLGIPFKRKQAKTCAFAILYGSGLATLAASLGSTVDEAGQIKGAYLSVLPGVKGLIDSLKNRAAANQPIRTWGGRLYYVEPPRVVDNRMRTYDYKLLNYLCQGGSADITKEAILSYDEHRVHGRLILTVHDQIVITVPKEHWRTEAAILKHCMESVKLDAKLLADSSHGPNLHDVKDIVC